MDQLSRTSLFSEISDLSVTGVDDSDQYKKLDAGTSKLVSLPSLLRKYSRVACWLASLVDALLATRHAIFPPQRDVPLGRKVTSGTFILALLEEIRQRNVFRTV